MNPTKTLDFKATIDATNGRITTAFIAHSMGRSTACTRHWYHGGNIPKAAMIMLIDILKANKVKIYA